MCYLLSPNQPVMWTDLPGRALVKALKSAPSLAVDKLQWVQAERQDKEDMLRVALVDGAACRQGIVVDGIDLAPLQGGAEIRRLGREVRASREALRANNEMMESLMPGWNASAIAKGRKRWLAQPTPSSLTIGRHWAAICPSDAAPCCEEPRGTASRRLDGDRHPSVSASGPRGGRGTSAGAGTGARSLPPGQPRRCGAWRSGSVPSTSPL
jgi:hypothetical protein